MIVVDEALRLLVELAAVFLALRFVVRASKRDAQREAPFVMPAQLPHRTPGVVTAAPAAPVETPVPVERPTGGDPGDRTIDILLEEFNSRPGPPPEISDSEHEQIIRVLALEERNNALVEEVAHLTCRLQRIESAGRTTSRTLLTAILAAGVGAAAVTLGHFLGGFFR